MLTFGGIRTLIVGVEGKHADHLTTITTTSIEIYDCLFRFPRFNWKMLDNVSQLQSQSIVPT